jgi:hypothetical protein
MAILIAALLAHQLPSYSTTTTGVYVPYPHHQVSVPAAKSHFDSPDERETIPRVPLGLLKLLLLEWLMRSLAFIIDPEN